MSQKSRASKTKRDNSLSCCIDLPDACQLARLVLEKSDSRVFIKIPDVLTPLVVVERLAPEITATFSRAELGSSTPNDPEVLLLFQGQFHIGVRDQVHMGGRELGSVIRVVRLSAKVLHDVSVFARDCHGIVGVDRIGLEPVGEGSCGQLVEHTALVDVEVVSGFVVSPVG